MWTVYCILCGGPPHRIYKKDLHPAPKQTGLGNPAIDHNAVAIPPQWAESFFRRPNSTFLKTICALFANSQGDGHFSPPGVYNDHGSVYVNVWATNENITKYPQIVNWERGEKAFFEDEPEESEESSDEGPPDIWTPNWGRRFTSNTRSIYSRDFAIDPAIWKQDADDGFLFHTVCSELFANHLSHCNLTPEDFVQWMKAIGLFLPRKIHGAISVAQEQCFEFREGIEWTIARPDIFPDTQLLSASKFTTTPPHNIFPSLPLELVPKILSNLSPKDLLTLESTSHAVKSFLSLPAFNTFYLHQCIQRRWRGPYLHPNPASEIPENTDWKQYFHACVMSPHVRNWDRIQRVLRYFDWGVKLWIREGRPSKAGNVLRGRLGIPMWDGPIYVDLTMDDVVVGS